VSTTDITTALWRIAEEAQCDCWICETAVDAATEIERLCAAGDALLAAIRNHDLREGHLRAWEEARRG
jgi:hypothetical protein